MGRARHHRTYGLNKTNGLYCRANLIDAAWKHGSTDGEIFTLKDGSKGTGMRGYGARMKSDDMWNVVNYLRALAPSTAKK